MALIRKNFGDIFTFSRASNAWNYGADGLLTQYGNDVMRNGIDPSTGLANGWLLESGSTNLMNSQTYTGYSQATGFLAPDPLGNMTGINLVPTTNLTGHYGDRSVQVTAGSTTCFSVYCKAGVSKFARLYMYGTGNALLSMTYQLEGAGNLGSYGYSSQYHDGGGTTSGSYIQNVGAGWYRCSLVGVPDQPATNRLCRVQALDASGNPAFSGDGTSTYVSFAWPQTETSTYPTSYIPAPTGPASRASDFLSITGSQLTALFGEGAPRGYAIADVYLMANTANSLRNVFQLDNGAQYMHIRPNSTGNSALGVTNVTGAQLTTPSAGNPPYGSVMRWGMRWGNGAFAICMNGGNIGNLALGTLPAFTTMRIGSGNTGSTLNGNMLGVWAGGQIPSDSKFQAACVLGADVTKIIGS